MFASFPNQSPPRCPEEATKLQLFQLSKGATFLKKQKSAGEMINHFFTEIETFLPIPILGGPLPGIILTILN